MNPIYRKFYSIAESQMGVHELPGRAQNKKILEYHATTSLGATDDETPWCSSFVNWCVKQAGFNGTNSAAARSWMKWGVPLKSPEKGCIVVFQRPGGNHVAFFDSDQGSEYIRVLGGNQGDQVSLSNYRKDRILGFRGIN